MFRFEHPEFLIAFVLIPIIAVVLWWQFKNRKIMFNRAGKFEVLRKLLNDFSITRQKIKSVSIILFFLLLFAGWTNPQWGNKTRKVKAKSSDVFIALDISKSMLAEDVRPSRMERARKFGENLIAHLKGERIGTIIFAGNAYLQMPLTTDYSAAMMFIKSSNPSQAPSQGTAISEAIEMAENSFDKDNKHHKALVIITDGENHDKETIAMAKKAADNGLLIFTVGVGTEKGGLIRDYHAGNSDYKRDKSGNPIMSKLNVPMLQELASIGDGTYFNLTDDTQAVVEALRDRIDKMEKRELEERAFSNFDSYFQYFLLLSLFFFIISELLNFIKFKDANA